MQELCYIWRGEWFVYQIFFEICIYCLNVRRQYVKKCGELYDEKATTDKTRMKELESAKGTMKVGMVDLTMKGGG